MDRLEQECENAVFEVCDARERYPAMCANELARCLKLENEICMTPVKANPMVKLEPPIVTKEQINFLESLGIGSNERASSIDKRNKKITHLLNKIEDLKVTMEQIEREKYSDVNNFLRE